MPNVNRAERPVNLEESPQVAYFNRLQKTVRADGRIVFLRCMKTTTQALRRLAVIGCLLLAHFGASAQSNVPDKDKIREDLNEILSDLSQNYAYVQQKKVDLDCIRKYYSARIDSIRTEEETVLFFELLLDEFYDSHVILNTNRQSSFRLSAPVYATFQNGKAVISNTWQSRVENWDTDVMGAEIKTINGKSIAQAIESFPTHCNDKSNSAVREWILNKLLAGRYNERRLLSLQLKNGTTTMFDLDALKYKNEKDLLNAAQRNNIGIIRINNSLGNNDLVAAFDKALDELWNTKGLVIDLRNTVDGGNSYTARGIMSRFISSSKPYQLHTATEQYGNNPAVERRWIEYVDPRGKTYTKPVVVLIDRWTGSMGEGIAVGFEGIGAATLVGTEMERLAGEMEGFSFRNQKFGYRLSTAKLFHVNGKPREEYVPANYVKQTTTLKDELLESALSVVARKAK